MKKMILTILSIFLMFNSYAYNLVAECNGCSASELQQKATQTSYALSHFGYVYVFNFSNHALHKYFAWEEDNNRSQIQGDYFDYRSIYKYLETKGVDQKDILDIYIGAESGDNSAGSFMNVAEVVTTNEEQTAFLDIDAVINRLGGITDIEGEFPPYLNNPQTGTIIGDNFGAFDLVGNNSLARALFNQVSDDVFSQRIITALQSIQTFLDIFKTINIDINFNIIVTLPDGSVGIAHLRHAVPVFDDSAFIDSDNNPVPFVPGDVSGRTFFFRGGEHSNNFIGFHRRLDLLGISHGSAGSGRRCIGFCNEEGCTTVCSRN